MKVSYSRVSSYLSCPYRHYLSYEEKLRLNRAKRPLLFGSDFHGLLEVRHSKKKFKEKFQEITEKYESLTPDIQVEMGENYLKDLKEIFMDYKKVYKKEEKPIIAEHEFLLPILKYKGEEVLFHGFVDEIYEGGILGEHKTFSRMPDMGVLAMNPQVCLYSKAWELEKGEKLQRVQWDYIKSTPAVQPIWLEKSNRFSTAKSQSITPFSWERACKERGIEDEEMINQGQAYIHNLDNFFFRQHMELLPVMVDTVWDDFIYTVKDLVKRSSTNKTKNITRDCSWCDYRPICFGEFTGADVEYIKEKEYITKER